MKLRTLVITVAVLAALSLTAYLANRPAPAPASDPRVGTVLLDADTLQKAASLTVSDQGKKVQLVRGASGGWTVPDYFGLPADFDKIAHFVQDLNEAKVDRFVTANPERLAHLQFKDAQVILGDSAGKEIWRLDLGRNADSGNGRFIRFGSEPKAYFSTLHVWLDTEPKAWADTRLVSVGADDVARIEIAFDGGPTVVLTRAKKGDSWAAAGLAAGQKVAETRIATLLSTLGGLRFSDTVDPKDAAAVDASHHARTFTLVTFAGKTLAVTLARKPEEKRLKSPVPDAKEATPALGKPADIKPVTPEFDTIPAGPVFVSVASSDPTDAVNLAMKKRAFETEEYSVTSLPQKVADLLEADKAK